MVGINRSKKVSRVARTGGSSRRRGESAIGFYVMLGVLTVVGIGLVVFSRDQRLDVTTPNNTAPLEPVSNPADPSLNRAGDRWYEAYGIYICDKFLPPIESERDPFGIATKGDGVMYIHPYEKQYAGQNATLGVFADAMEFDLTEDSITPPGSDTTYTTDKTKCGDTPGELVVKEWVDPAKPGEGTILRHDARDIRVKNNAAVTIAFVPEGKEDIPLPESVANGALAGAPAKDAPATQQQAPETPAAPGGQ